MVETNLRVVSLEEKAELLKSQHEQQSKRQIGQLLAALMQDYHWKQP